MNDDQAEKALRDLFREAGPLHASEALDARIMARIAVTRNKAPVVDTPLIGFRGWVFALVLVGLVMASSLLPGAGRSGLLQHAFDHLPLQPFITFLCSSWAVGGLIVCSVLFALNLLLMSAREREQRI
jgi:hypothetical protein